MKEDLHIPQNGVLKYCSSISRIYFSTSGFETFDGPKPRQLKQVHFT